MTEDLNLRNKSLIWQGGSVGPGISGLQHGTLSHSAQKPPKLTMQLVKVRQLPSQGGGGGGEKGVSRLLIKHKQSQDSYYDTLNITNKDTETY